MPRAWPEIPIRPESRARMAMVNPSPSPPSRLAAGTRASSSTSSPVGDPCRPILWKICPTRSHAVAREAGADPLRQAHTRRGAQPAPAVLAGDEHPHEPRFGRCLDRLLRETVVPVDLGGKGLNHPSSKLPNGGAKPRVLG